MPELDFKGKEFVRNHHLTVPFRPLVPDAEKSVGPVDLNGNLIIHGDNLEALKSLLPMYAGKVDCIFIDPPYNTGNEGWCYNDNVNSPELKRWFSENPVGIDDGLRHDKWCCMMWPRLKLLWELLAEDGTIWITIDDIEQHRLKCLLDEIFGKEQLVGTVCWQKKYATANDTVDLSYMHDFIAVYCKGRPDGESRKSRAVLQKLGRTEKQDSIYKNPDNDPRGLWTSGDYSCNKTADERPSLYFPLIRPGSGEEVWPDRSRVWRVTKENYERDVENNRLWWGIDGLNDVPRYKRFLTEVGGVVASSWWPHEFAGHTDEAMKEIRSIFEDNETEFSTPKPTRLLSRIIELASKSDDLILDSFAGSGTTAHAVLKMNAQDGGNRKFILVELEDYADKITAERVRRVINGYPYQGTQRETLFERKLTWTELKKSAELLEEVENTKRSYDDQFDKIKQEVKDGVLKVIGERNVKETAPGLGGSFTYCTLGKPIELANLLSGKDLPDREGLADWLLYIASGTKESEEATIPVELQQFFVAKQGGVYYWLFYQPDQNYLTSPEAALTIERAELIQAVDPNAEHRIFGPAKYVGSKLMRERGMHIEFATLPFALFRRGMD